MVADRESISAMPSLWCRGQRSGPDSGIMEISLIVIGGNY
jgi:hypothetical protein